MATTATERDLRHLKRTLELAARGLGHTSPNPLVGAVVVKDGRVIGEGFHAAAGLPHAEREALADCDEDPAGATLYVSLEPCAHRGRTPPCTDAILEAGIGRVVVASDDPTPKASGRGLGILRDEGVAVEVLDGEIAHEARLLNQPFRKHARTGDSRWISGKMSRARVHRWRAEADAVAVGVGTALADDPLLTARIEGVSRQPRRVVFDSEARLPLGSALVRSASEVPLILVCSRAAKRTAVQAVEAAGVDVLVASGENEAARVVKGLDELGAREVQSILLEGGPHLAGAFLEAGEIDEARIFVAPIVAGGRDARTALDGQGAEEISRAARARATEVEQIDDDVLITARFEEW